jgi:hypothetical protein
MESKSGVRGRRITGRRMLVAGVCATSVIVLAAGCGRQEEHAASDSGSGQNLLVAQAAAPGVSPQGASQAQTTTIGEGMAVGSADSLPPDVAVAVADTLVYPGGSVEITAEGSPDVVGVTLSDGIGRKQPFVYDAGSDTWKVFYRVPIKAGTERLGLSVTARNASQRWRRVWLFLIVKHETSGASVPAAEPDSSEKR